MIELVKETGCKDVNKEAIYITKASEGIIKLADITVKIMKGYVGFIEDVTKPK